MKYGNAYTTPEWRALVRQVRRRSGGWCEGCGRAPVDGDPHHLRYAPFKGKKRVLVPLDALIDLCRPCHLAAERLKREGKSAAPGFTEEF